MKILLLLLALMFASCEQGSSSSGSDSEDSAAPARAQALDNIYGTYVSDCLEGTGSDISMANYQKITIEISESGSTWSSDMYTDQTCGSIETNLVTTVTHGIDISYSTEAFELSSSDLTNHILEIEFLSTTVVIKHPYLEGYAECDTTFDYQDVDYEVFDDCPYTKHGESITVNTTDDITVSGSASFDYHESMPIWNEEPSSGLSFTKQ